MNYGEIKDCDIANGSGVRVSLFVSGCTHHCEGCFNPQTWDFAYGEPFTADTEEKLLEMLSKAFIKGLTLLGGEPLESENQQALLPFLKRVRETLPNKDIWCYTGYTFGKDIPDVGDGVTEQLLSLIDVLVDGEFILSQKSAGLKFRGSANQRVIDLKSSLKTGETVLLFE